MPDDLTHGGSASEPEKKCPFCAELIKAEAVKCKHCGSDLSQNRGQQPPKDKPKGGCMMGCLTVIAIFAVLIMLGSILGRCSGNSSSKSDLPSTPSGSVLTGDNGVLDYHGNETFVLGTTEANYEAVSHSAVVNDTRGIAEAVVNGQAFLVPRFAKVKVISGGFLKKQYRVLTVPAGSKFSGCVGLAGWGPSEWVRPEK